MQYLVHDIMGYGAPLFLLFDQDPDEQQVAARLRRLRVKGPKDYLEFNTTPILDHQAWKEEIGREWNIPRIVQEVAQQEVQQLGDDVWGRQLYIGSLINPSHCYYLPFACSNVAGDCRVCGGKEELPNALYDAARYERASAERRALTLELQQRHAFFAEWPPVLQRRARVYDRVMKRCGPMFTCPRCNGCGSQSARDDEQWREAFEALLEEHGLYLENSEGCPTDYLVVQYLHDYQPQEEEEVEA